MDKLLRTAPFVLFALIHGSVGITYLTKGSLGVAKMFNWPGTSDQVTMPEDLAVSLACSYDMVLCGLSTLALFSSLETRRLVLGIEAAVFGLAGLFHTQIKQELDYGPLVLSGIAAISLLIPQSPRKAKSS